MGSTTNAPPIQHIYRGNGIHSVRMPLWDADEPTPRMVPTIADTVQVCQIMTRDVVCAREDLEVAALLELIVRRHIGCVPIVDDRGRPVGMVTKFDLVEQLMPIAQPAPGPPPRIASDVMMPLAITLDERATVAHVAAMMSVEDVHHVPIISDAGALIGVVSAMDVVRWLATNDGVLEADIVVNGPR
jgi:CBS domain-containing protein